MKNYPGGKGSDGVYHRIINQIPPHDLYIEAFVGAGAILLHKRPAACSIVIDADPEVIYRWLNFGHDHHAENGETISLPGLHAIHGDAKVLLPGCIANSGVPCSRIFVYCDPPYLLETRRSKRALYKIEMSDRDNHEELLVLLLSLDCMVAISGYQSSLYSTMLQTWRSISYQVGTRGGTAATEYLWMNYPEPAQLHDYRYLGQGYREREKINRQRRRWLARLKRMNQLQRLSLAAAIAEFTGTGSE